MKIESGPILTRNERGGEGVKIVCTATVHSSADDLYAFWRRLENLPLVLDNLISVTQISHTESHWVAKGPGGKRIEWDSEIINETPGKMVAWRTKPNARPMHAGSVRFEPAPDGRGTEVKVSFEYHPPGGMLGELAAKLTGQDPRTEIEGSLRRLKELTEKGVIPSTTSRP